MKILLIIVVILPVLILCLSYMIYIFFKEKKKLIDNNNTVKIKGVIYKNYTDKQKYILIDKSSIPLIDNTIFKTENEELIDISKLDIYWCSENKKFIYVDNNISLYHCNVGDYVAVSMNGLNYYGEITLLNTSKSNYKCIIDIPGSENLSFDKVLGKVIFIG